MSEEIFFQHSGNTSDYMQVQIRQLLNQHLSDHSHPMILFLWGHLKSRIYATQFGFNRKI